MSTKRDSTSIPIIKDILEKGFIAGASSHSHSSPVHAYYVDSDTWELLMDLENATKSSSLCAVKQSESPNSCVKTNLHNLTQGISDSSLVCFCKNHRDLAAFDLSGLPCEHPSRAGCLMDMVSRNTSTPCKKEHPKELESLLSKSTDLAGDLSTLGKIPAPGWEISAIKAPLDTSLSLDASTEELRLQDMPALETSVVAPLAWPGALKQHPALLHRPATLDTQPGDPEPTPGCLHQAP
ncbi:uncharacterized protein LOC130155998 [Falco biarmicus]|uniref:uncharacterized protein LOC130155998 n=1 Tax=Falco biarmicus TaxID=345155 RepID=UPI0024BD4FED|nr:uncharacterized protein LOC130155998 [Falco biarmicus]